MQRRGIEATLDALREGEATLVLLQLDAAGPRVDEVLRLAEAQSVPVHRGTSRDLWRMALPGPDHPLALALVDRHASIDDVTSLLKQPGPVVLLDGVRYATNVGFVLRTAEVAGASGVVLVSEESPSRSWMKDVAHASMGANRFLPLVHTTPAVGIEAFKASERPLIVAEDVGDRAPWDVPIPWNAVLAVGSEADGVRGEVLDVASAVVRLPMPGFVPSYNLQVAATALLMECLRQRAN
jgi:23S rRNA (guanosine2251-2'-O)-methyltransferase